MNNLSLTPAATVLLVRDCDNELEVLMVKRSKRPPFGNLYVFPGGKIDESDKHLNIVNYSCEANKVSNYHAAFYFDIHFVNSRHNRSVFHRKSDRRRLSSYPQHLGINSCVNGNNHSSTN